MRAASHIRALSELFDVTLHKAENRGMECGCSQPNPRSNPRSYHRSYHRSGIPLKKVVNGRNVAAQAS